LEGTGRPAPPNEPRAGKYNLEASFVQANPNKTKQKSLNFLGFIVKIWAFQWVTGKKIKKIDSRLRLCAKRLKHPHLPPPLSSPPGVHPDNRNI
jgi:hypothetical protein